MEVDLNFQEQFYNLQGTNIREQKKNLYKLLNSKPLDLAEEELKITPRNYLETVFYVDVLIHFRKVPELTDILKQNNGVFTSKILKQPWFFSEVFKNMSNDDIVNNFLPALGYSLRMKVLKKISNVFSGDRMDNIFDLVLERYGIFIAQEFLHNCTMQKCIDMIKQNQLNLHCGQLKRLLHKDPNIIKIYMEEYKSNTDQEFCDKDFINYIVWKNPELFYELDICGNTAKAGKLTTKKLLALKEDIIMNNFDKYKDRLNKKQVVIKMKTSGKIDLTKYFSTEYNFEVYKRNIASVLKYFPKKHRWNLLSSTYKQFYHKDIISNFEVYDVYLDVIPIHFIRQWAETRYKESENVEYLQYFESGMGMQLIKEKFNFTSKIDSRSTLLNTWAKLCIFNKDCDCFDQLLKHICTRHRNDDTAIKYLLRKGLLEVIKSGITVTTSNWATILEIIDIQRVKRRYIPMEIESEYLVYLHTNNLPIEEFVTLFLKDFLSVDVYSFDCLLSKNVKSNFAILSIIGKLLTSELTTETKHYRLFISKVLEVNKSTKEFKIDLNDFPALVAYVKSKLEEKKLTDLELLKVILLYNDSYPEKQLEFVDDDEFFGRIKDFIKESGYYNWFDIIQTVYKKNRAPLQDKLLHLFLSDNNLQIGYNERNKLIKYYLKYEPDVIASHCQVILNSMSIGQVLKPNLVRCYVELHNSCVLHYKTKLSETKESYRKRDIVENLSKIMDPSEFLEFTRDYIPAAKKLDLENEEQRELYSLQCSLAKSFRNLENHSEAIQVLMKFCHGDYLKYSLFGLYKIMYNLPEHDVERYINELTSRAVSTRKHATFFALDLLSVKIALNIFIALYTKESNASVKKTSLKCLLKYFKKTSQESLLDVIISFIGTIDKKDDELLGYFIDTICKLPRNYQSPFIEKLWVFAETLEKKQSTQNKLINVMARSNLKTLSTLDKVFYRQVVKHNFMTDEDAQYYTNMLTLNYLEVYPTDEDFTFIFDIIKQYKEKYWNFDGRNKIEDIFTFFTNAYRLLNKNNNEFLSLFKNHWERIFTNTETLDQHVLLQLLSILRQHQKLDLFACEVNQTLKSLVSTFGYTVLGFLKKCIKEFFDSEYERPFNMIEFGISLVECEGNEINYSIASYLIRNNTEDNLKQFSFKLFDLFGKSDNAAVKIHLNHILSTLN